MFDRVAAKPVLGALDGLNGTVFAYGQTGSGKTFTITGGAERYVDRGIVPRAVTKLFSEITKRANDGATYEVTVSYVEVYNDQAYDLLFDGENPRGSDGVDRAETTRRGETPKKDADVLNTRVNTRSSNLNPNDDSSSFLPKVALLEDDDGVIHARGCSAHRAGSEEEALNLLFLGDVNRAVAETPMNLQSSRSHCVFTMVVERREPGALTVRRGKLNLVDLAGSERVGKSGVEELGALREAKHINLSLHALEKVVVALSDGDPHVPYRDSVMTMLLKDSLGGNCATAMVATVSPEFEHVFEGISTCRFALRIASVRNSQTVNEETDPKLVIKRLREENRALREELKLARGDADGGRETLSESELARLRSDVERFCGDDDALPEALDLGGSVLKIRAAMGFFRQLVNAARASGCTKPSRVYETGTNDEVESHGGESTEAARLADVVRRRDDEIKALVAMLEKRESLPEATRRVSTLGGSDTGTGDEPSSISAKPPAKPSTPEATPEELRLPPRRRFADRNAAFEHFKRAHVARGAVEANKKTLREQYATAKKLGEAVNASRTAIASMKSDIEKARVKRAFFAEEPTACDTGDHAHDEMRTAYGDSNETRALLQKVDEEKRAYKKNYDALRDLKKEIERVQSMLERSRGRVMREFEDWFGEGDSDGTRDAGDGDAGDGDAGVPSTGNAEADADIAAFYAARRKLLRSSREPSSRGSSRGGSSSRGSSESSFGVLEQ